MKKILFPLVLIIICVLILLTRSVIRINKSTIMEKEITYISRSNVAKMMALLYFNHDEIQKYDSDDGNWYTKYFNATQKCGAVWQNDDKAPGDNITYGEIINVMSGMSSSQTSRIEKAAKRMIGDKLAEDYLSSEEWLLLFDIFRDEIINSSREMFIEEIFLLSIIEGDETSWKVATNKGVYYFEGFAVDAYVNGSIRILSDGTDIVYIYGMADKESILENVWVEDSGNDTVKIYCSDSQGILAVSDDLKDRVHEREYIADICVNDGIVTGINIKSDRRTDKILSVNENGIVTYQNGTLNFAKNCKIYRLYDEICETSKNNIVIGYNVSDFVLDEKGNVCAVLITSKVEPTVIRVAIKTDGYKDYYHKAADISSDEGMTVTIGEESIFHPAGENITISKEEMQDANIYITPATEDGRLIINSIKRAYGAPVYRGNIELSASEKGIIIINEVEINEYLYSVIPSEMPVSYGKEALKVQAVCARSYAYIQVMQGGLAGLGAHVDDSTSYQVYNNSPETPESIAAVLETEGQVLMFNGKVVPAYYYSTSCGSSADGNEVWLGMKSVSYLAGRLQIIEGDGPGEQADLSDEKNFKAFLDNKEIKTFDSNYPWYRWKVSVPKEEIKESVEANLKKRYEINPTLILTKRGKFYKSEPVSSIGIIKSIKVVKRAKGGIVTEVMIRGSKETLLVKSEYNIRMLLAPGKTKIYRNDGSIVDGLSVLPSAFFIVNMKKTKAGDIFDFYGGGYGHGVGMSQNGTKTMADKGYSYKDILGFYFKGCTVENYSS